MPALERRRRWLTDRLASFSMTGYTDEGVANRLRPVLQRSSNFSPPSYTITHVIVIMYNEYTSKVLRQPLIACLHVFTT